MVKFVSSCCLCILLTGCIGSTFVSDEGTVLRDFPSLHSVPQRKDMPLRTQTETQNQELTALQQQHLEENQRLRAQFLDPARAELKPKADK
jgi:hypothetical protein